METIGDRINHVVAYSGLTKSHFGLAINISQSMVSKLCNNSATPSDRTISDICRVFDINEDWLRTGDGKMINYEAREKDIEDFLGAPLNDIPAMRPLIVAFTKLNSEGQDKAVERVEELTEVPKYQKTHKKD